MQDNGISVQKFVVVSNKQEAEHATDHLGQFTGGRNILYANSSSVKYYLYMKKNLNSDGQQLYTTDINNYTLQISTIIHYRYKQSEKPPFLSNI